MKKESELKDVQAKLKKMIELTNDRIRKLGDDAFILYKALNSIQECFDNIRNVPNEKKLQYQKLKEIRLNWKSQVDKIETDYNKAFRKNIGSAATGVSAGIAIASLGPTAAMGVATTFGVASTGTAISTLSGAAATNAALAWLGGGTLAAGGGGIAAGSTFLTMAGPIGWTIAGIAIATSGVIFWKSHQKKTMLEEIFTVISKRDIGSYNLAIVELNERIQRVKEESNRLMEGVKRIQSFGYDYTKMSEQKQYELGTYVNLMNTSTQLLVNPIDGLQPKYTEKDFYEYIQWSVRNMKNPVNKKYKKTVISLSNLLYCIELDSDEWEVLYKSLSKNKDFLNSVDLSKKDFSKDIIEWVSIGLKHHYNIKQHKINRR